jgi:hypothetical protein
LTPSAVVPVHRENVSVLRGHSKLSRRTPCIEARGPSVRPCGSAAGVAVITNGGWATKDVVGSGKPNLRDLRDIQSIGDHASQLAGCADRDDRYIRGHDCTTTDWDREPRDCGLRLNEVHVDVLLAPALLAFGAATLSLRTIRPSVLRRTE